MEGPKGILEMFLRLHEGAAGPRNPAESPLDPTGPVLEPRLPGDVERPEGQGPRLPDVAVPQISFGQKVRHQALHGPEFILGELLDRPLQERDSLGGISLLQIRIAEPPGGEGGVEGIGRAVEGEPAGLGSLPPFHFIRAYVLCARHEGDVFAEFYYERAEGQGSG